MVEGDASFTAFHALTSPGGSPRHIGGHLPGVPSCHFPSTGSPQIYLLAPQPASTPGGWLLSQLSTTLGSATASPYSMMVFS